MSSDRPSETRLPDDPAYWEDLAARSIDAAFGGTARDRDAWWRGMSDGAFVLAASAVFALLGASLVVDARSPGGTAGAHAFAELHGSTPGPIGAALAPDDPMLVTLLDASAGPPPPAVLLRLVALREEAR
jgi:hypothetical protein